MNTYDRNRGLSVLTLALAVAIGAAACDAGPDATGPTGAQQDAGTYDDAYEVDGVERPTRSRIDDKTGETDATAPDTQLAVSATAAAELRAASDSNVAGTLEFIQDGDTLRIEGEITGLAPGQHGLHVHEFGDCSAPDASSAGEHFAPRSSEHGAPTDPTDERHAGDLGNIVAGEGGRAKVTVVADSLTLQGGESIVGRAIVVHADADDLETQPSGNSGSRVGCGVIERQATGTATG
ncbi:MAG TPA: superoxide dismutase family protein [Woeseiaceae bacterium]|nr:superoxide dismutase family protein [Woeseiaceae bacterium]